MNARSLKQRERGLTLIELMVSLAIGSLLIVGAVTVYSQSRNTSRVSDTVARLQENARFAFSLMEPDIQLAGYYGYSNRPSSFSFIKGGSTGSGIPASGLSSTASPVDLGGSGAPCGTNKNFVVNLVATAEGGQENDKYFGCPPEPEPGGEVAITAKDGADSLTVRHASVERAAPTAKTVQLIASRLDSGGNYIFSDGTLPTTIEQKPDMVEIRDLIVRTYYVADQTEHPFRANVPALRVKSLIPGPVFRDDELISGVEDLQVEYGLAPKIDTDGDGIKDSYSGAAVRYSNKAEVGMQVVSVRVWLLMRAEQIEPGFVDNHRYKYVDKDVTPGDAYRRVLVSKTIQLRNSRTM